MPIIRIHHKHGKEFIMIQFTIGIGIPGSDKLLGRLRIYSVTAVVSLIIRTTSMAPIPEADDEEPLGDRILK